MKHMKKYVVMLFSFFLCAGLYAQVITVSGVVRDKELNEPLAGVNVLVSGTTNGTITDINGRYSIKTDSKALLVFSYLSMQNVEERVNGRSKIDVTMASDVEALEEVVVVGYATQKKINLSGAVATADTKVLADRPASNVGLSLQGAVANLNITPESGDPNDLPDLNIRGYTSINGGSPLVIIDGAASDNTALNRLNPADIENISVLKDASSAAIYGSRAAFGVILITTKQGKSEKVTVNYNANFDWRGLTVRPEYIEDPYTYYTDRNRTSNNGSIYSSTFPQAFIEAILAYQEDPVNNPYYWLSSYDEYFFMNGWDPVDAYINNHAFSTTHNINISGKTDKVNYYISGAYQYQDGMVKYGENTYNQYNTRAKVDIQVTPWWQVSMNSGFVATKYDTSSYYLDYHDADRSNKWSGFSSVMEVIIGGQNVNFGPQYKDENGYVYDWANVIGYLEDGGKADKYDNIVTEQIGTQIDIIKDVLKVNGLFNFSYQHVNTDAAYLPFYCTGGFDSYLAMEGNDGQSSVYSKNARVRRMSYDAYATFNKVFGGKHDLTAILGFNQEKYYYNYDYTTKSDLITSSIPSIALAYGNVSTTESTTEWAVRGFYGRLGYSYNNKYIAEFNFREDLTSKFQKDHRTVWSPSGSVAWNISEESFFKPLKKTVDQLKIRASYGVLGNQDVDAYAYLATMSASQSSYLIGGTQPMVVSAPGLVAGDLTWEKVATFDFGLDLSMFNNRLTFSGDIYRRDTRDMLTSQGVSLPAVLGASEPEENAADLKTVGWEITLGWRDKFTLANKPFHYQVSFNLSDAKAEITKVSNSTGALGSYYVGKEINEVWGLTNMGLFESDEEADAWPDQSTVLYSTSYPDEAGTTKWADLNGDGAVTRGSYTLDDHGDLTKIANETPRYRFGLTLGAEWNGFDLSMFFQGVMKHQYYPDWWDNVFWGLYSLNWGSEPVWNSTERWTEDNQDTSKYFPKLNINGARSTSSGLGQPQTKYLQNAAYIRLKNLTFGYTLPQSLTRKFFIQNLRIYYSGENLFFITGLKKGYNADPENLGWEFYPLQRHHSIGINVTF